MAKNEGTEKEGSKQVEFTEEVLKAVFTDVTAGLLDGVLKDQRNEFKNELEEQLKLLKADPSERKPMGEEEAEAFAKEEKAKDKALGKQPLPFKSLGDQLDAVRLAAQNGNPHKGLSEIHKAAQGLGESIPSDGGFLVQKDQSDELLKLLHETDIIMSRIRMIPISANSNGLKLNAVDETSRANGSRWGGMRAYWTDEADDKTKSKPKFRQMELNLKKLTGLAYATDELLADTAALATVIQQGFVEEFGFKTDDAFINGDGAGKPYGIRNAPATVSVAKETAQAAATVVTENIFKMWSRMWARSRTNAVWHINQDVEPQLFGMSLAVGTGGVPVYMPAGGLSGSPFSQLFGRPIIPLEQCQTLGTTGDIYFVDWSQYVGINKGGMQSASSMHVRFVNDEMAFRFVIRLDGQPAWVSALTPFKGTNTQSPYIKLDSRT